MTCNIVGNIRVYGAAALVREELSNVIQHGSESRRIGREARGSEVGWIDSPCPQLLKGAISVGSKERAHDFFPL